MPSTMVTPTRDCDVCIILTIIAPQVGFILKGERPTSGFPELFSAVHEIRLCA